tara:strand:+ start:349 stop:657 length:309 start_codon:yes stop_codon:yes gene_type:complete
LKITRRQLRNLIREEVARISEDTGDTGEREGDFFRVRWVSVQGGKEYIHPTDRCFSEAEAEELASILRDPDTYGANLSGAFLAQNGSVQVEPCEPVETGLFA